jgi:hypothetical protein
LRWKAAPLHPSLTTTVPGIRVKGKSTSLQARVSLKLYWWGNRYHVNPYFFAPGGNERSGFHETGAGSLAELNRLGHGRTVVGVNGLRGTSRKLDRTLIGPYARLGFGKWGIFAEHHITMRTPVQTSTVSFRQDAGYGQIFWAVKE